VSLDSVFRAPPGTFPVERFSKMEVLNVECISRLNAPPESVLEETDFYTHSTFRNLLIEGQMWGDSSEAANRMSYSYFLKRSISLIPTILGVTLVVFVIVRSIPGDPVIILFGGFVTGEQLETTRRLLGLDQPIYVQYFLYLARLLQGDWGYSIELGVAGAQPVLSLVLQKFVATLQLAVLSMIMASVLGVFLGVLSATNRGRVDNICRTVSLLGFSIPVFWIGMIFITVFSLHLRLLPSMGRGGPEYLVLPTLTLATYLFGMISRVTRAAALDVTHQDFILTAQAKGLRRRQILVNHILRNSLIPVVTVVTLQFGSLIGGAVVTETVFNYPGLGLLLVQSLLRRDYPVIQGGMLLIAIVMTLSVLASDVLYMRLDPRIRFAKRD